MQYPVGSPWERVFGWRFLDPWDAIEPYAAELPPREPLVVLSHLGLSLDERLAQRVPRIDLLLGGHSHDTLAQPRYAGDVPIVHAGPYGKFVSRSELVYSPDRRRFVLRDFALASAAGSIVTRVLFVSNGHGEAAIADRIAREMREMEPGSIRDHLALVGESAAESMREVGPRRAMPSGGLIAMGNVRNMLRDLRAGLLSLVAAQRRFLRSVRGSYDAAVAVGDVYCLAMARRAQTKTIFVGTAKSVSVAPYGKFERRLLSRAQACFVRDDATVRSLREEGLSVEPSRKRDRRSLRWRWRILTRTAASGGFDPALALFPGSRPSAYGDAAFLLQVVAEVAAAHPSAGAVLSIAPGLDPQRFAADAQCAGWELSDGISARIPFVLSARGRAVVRAWNGPLGVVLARADLVLGQAGTANEGAASAGVPVVAFDRERDTGSRWYRRRQQGLLDGALAVLPGDLPAAVRRRRRTLERSRSTQADGRDRAGAHGRPGRRATHCRSRAGDRARGLMRRFIPPGLALIYSALPLFPSFIALTGVAFPGVSLLPMPATLAVLGGCCVLAVYAIVMLARYPLRGARPLLLPLLSIFAAGLLAGCLGFDPRSGLLFTFIGGLGIVWHCSIMRFYGDRYAAPTLFCAYLLSGGIAAAVAIATVVLRVPPALYALQHGRATGTFILPGELAGYLIVLLPVAFAVARVASLPGNSRARVGRLRRRARRAGADVLARRMDGRGRRRGIPRRRANPPSRHCRRGCGCRPFGDRTALQRASRSERRLHAPLDLAGGDRDHQPLSAAGRRTVQFLASLFARPRARR